MTEKVSAARYIRMSSEHQRYSPTAQREAIQEFAEKRGYRIIAEFADEGKSGLGLKGRPGLRRLLELVIGGGAPFSAILVLDVSRWGRFQDPDRAAHYEYVCREAGVNVLYCAEPFDNDGNPISNIVKNLKRVMAAEYSRELGEKVLTGQLAGARAGYKQGGTAPFALRRVLIDEDGSVVQVLNEGQAKLLRNHRVVLVPGPDEEIWWLRSIFQRFVIENVPLGKIAAQIRDEGCVDSLGVPLRAVRLRGILKNEIYTGVYIFNRSSQRLQKSLTANPSDAWAVSEMATAVIDPELFKKAQGKLKSAPRYRLDKETVLLHLREIWRSNGNLSNEIINQSPKISSSSVYNHFGSLTEAYRLIGFQAGYKRLVHSPSRFSDVALIESLKQILRRHGHITQELVAMEGIASVRTYAIRFGSLIAAYGAAGWEVTHEDTRYLAAARRRAARKKPRLDPS